MLRFRIIAAFQPHPHVAISKHGAFADYRCRQKLPVFIGFYDFFAVADGLALPMQMS